MSLANTAKEPCNYFLLLRALFRSIGGGSHEQLYHEFLPLLADLLLGKIK
jgi:transformation/transcription domain-associated protein